MPVELRCVALAGLLVLAQILLAAAPKFLTYGVKWASSARDTTPDGLSLRGQRLERAHRNLMETFPVFAAAAIGVVVAGVSSAVTETAAAVWVLARVLYVPAYVFHVRHVRPLVWGVALLALVVLLAALIGG